MAGLLVVGAHALDAEVLGGGLAALATRRGWKARLLHLTRGERGHPSKPPAKFAAQLEREMVLAASRLGVEQAWLGVEAPLPEPERVTSAVTTMLDRFAPDAVVTHWRGSWHPSHRRAHEAVVQAVTQARRPPVLLFGENCEDLTGFRPRCFAPVQEVFDVWLEALRAYELFRGSEPGAADGNGIPYWAYYTAAARVRGLQVGLELAQAFMPAADAVPEGLDLRCLTEG